MIMNFLIVLSALWALGLALSLALATALSLSLSLGLALSLPGMPCPVLVPSPAALAALVGDLLKCAATRKLKGAQRTAVCGIHGVAPR